MLGMCTPMMFCLDLMAEFSTKMRHTLTTDTGPFPFLVHRKALSGKTILFFPECTDEQMLRHTADVSLLSVQNVGVGTKLCPEFGVLRGEHWSRLAPDPLLSNIYGGQKKFGVM